MMMRIFAICNLLMLVLLGITVLRDASPEWKGYMREYNRMLLAKTTDEQVRQSIRNMPLNVQQIWVEEWNKADRCTSCHLGVENPEFKDAPQPFTTHSHYRRHEFRSFGCTVCHQGQGRATTKSAAHVMEDLHEGWSEIDVREKGWEWPMLPLEYVESSCGRCHDALSLEEAPTLMAGAKLVQAKGCLGCHTIGDRGGKAAPELTEAGTKFFNAHGYTKEFEHVRFGYLTESLLKPKANDKNSIMPVFKFTQEQARQIVTYMLSLRDEEFSLPKYDIPRKTAAQVAVAVPKAADPGSGNPEAGKQSYATYCATCHGADGKGSVPAAAAMNPKPSDHTDDAYMSTRTDEQLFQVIKRGGAAIGKSPLMPAWGASLNDAQVWDVVAFVRSLHRPAAAAPPAAPAAPAKPQAAASAPSGADLAAGKQHYQTYCATCHGADGKGSGPAAAALNPKPADHTDDAYMSTRTDEQIFNSIKRGGAAIGKSPLMPAWGASLNDAQIRDVIAFIRSLHRKG